MARQERAGSRVPTRVLPSWAPTLAREQLAVQQQRRTIGTARVGDGKRIQAARNAPKDFPGEEWRLIVTRGTVTNKTIRKLQAALKHDRNNAEAHKRLAIAYADKGNLSEAIDEFQAALEINPDDAEVRYSLASVHGERGI